MKLYATRQGRCGVFWPNFLFDRTNTPGGTSGDRGTNAKGVWMLACQIFLSTEGYFRFVHNHYSMFTTFTKPSFLFTLTAASQRATLLNAVYGEMGVHSNNLCRLDAQGQVSKVSELYGKKHTARCKTKPYAQHLHSCHMHVPIT